MPDTLTQQVQALLVSQLSLPEDKVRPDADLRHDLGLDSFAAVELAFAVEEQYGIKVADDELAAIKTVGDLVEAVRRRVAPPTAQ